MIKPRLLFYLTLGLVLAAPAQQSNQVAIVSGRVLDAQGLPVPDAKISIFPMAAVSGGMPSATTDRDGRYRLVSPPFGDTWFSAVKETAGYPDTNALLFAPEVDDRPKVFLGPGTQTTLDIHLGVPDGILEGVVTDAAMKAKIGNARITLRREAPKAIYSGTLPPDGHFLFALPPTRIEISVTAPGYLPWKYRDSQTGSDKIVLPNSNRQTLSVQLIAER
jgi:Carboxypeptidase regulatory-like domain